MRIAGRDCRHSGAAKSQRPATENKEDGVSRTRADERRRARQPRHPPDIPCDRLSHGEPIVLHGRSRMPAGYTLNRSALPIR